jgi:protein-S-isoprenylcysteine O-methyltransferase Ste14
MMRTFWVLFGFGSQFLFLFTAWHLFIFLQGSEPFFPVPTLFERAGAGAGPWWVNGLLAAQFGISHSLLLWPRVRERLTHVAPRPLYGCLFCVATCVSLLLIMTLWRPSDLVLWRLDGPAATAVEWAYLLCWGGLFYSLSLTGLGQQTGWTPFWAWLRRREPPPRRFEPRGAYRVLRHPVYLAVLGLVWLTPAVTLDRAILIAVWTGYIFLGSYFKDLRLAAFLGESYRRYQAHVPGYPFVWFGPLGRVAAPDWSTHAPARDNRR